MRDLNERVTYLERRMEDHTSLMADLRGEMRDLRSELRADFASLRLAVDGGFARADDRLSRLDQKVDRHFMWLVGMMLTAFTAMFAALIGMTYR